MITNDKGIVELKHQILREVCRLAWNNELTNENCERLMLKIIPGPKPQYRCCIYKEREIVRGRIRLAMGLNPNAASESRNVVAVIPAVPLPPDDDPVCFNGLRFYHIPGFLRDFAHQGLLRRFSGFEAAAGKFITVILPDMIEQDLSVLHNDSPGGGPPVNRSFRTVVLPVHAKQLFHLLRFPPERIPASILRHSMPGCQPAGSAKAG